MLVCTYLIWMFLEWQYRKRTKSWTSVRIVQASSHTWQLPHAVEKCLGAVVCCVRVVGLAVFRAINIEDDILVLSFCCKLLITSNRVSMHQLQCEEDICGPEWVMKVCFGGHFVTSLPIIIISCCIDARVPFLTMESLCALGLKVKGELQKSQHRFWMSSIFWWWSSWSIQWVSMTNCKASFIVSSSSIPTWCIIPKDCGLSWSNCMGKWRYHHCHLHCNVFVSWQPNWFHWLVVLHFVESTRIVGNRLYYGHQTGVHCTLWGSNECGWWCSWSWVKC